MVKPAKTSPKPFRRMRTFRTTVTQGVEVMLDEKKFTDQFMREFRKQFYHFLTIEEHAQHLAQMYARGLISNLSSFIEGYGPAHEMGISFKTTFTDTEYEP